MFKNIGKKFMKLAKVMFWVMLVSFVVSGIALVAVYASYDSYYSVPDYLLIIGLVMLFVGPILAWLSSWGIYSWGNLVDNVQAIRENGGVAPVKASEQEPVAPVEAKAEEVAPIPAPVVEAPKPVDPRVKKLDMLLANGLITEDEYNRAIANF